MNGIFPGHSSYYPFQKRKVVTYLVLASVLSAVFWMLAAESYAQQDMRRAWDLGRTRPESALVEPGSSVPVPGTLDTIDNSWRHCSRACAGQRLDRYPLVIPVHSILAPQRQRGYLTINPLLYGLRVAATKDAGYLRVVQTPDGRVSLYGSGKLQGSVVIWNEAMSAPAN